MNDLVTRLRDNFEGCGGHDEHMHIRNEAADELERLYAAMAKGPIVWTRLGSHFREMTCQEQSVDDGWQPLYFIPAPEPKP